MRPWRTVKLTFSSATMPPNRIVSCAISNKGAPMLAVVSGSGGGEVVMPIGPPLARFPPQAPFYYSCLLGLAAAAGQQNVTRRECLRQRKRAGYPPNVFGIFVATGRIIGNITVNPLESGSSWTALWRLDRCLGSGIEEMQPLRPQREA